MATISHEPMRALPRPTSWLDAVDMWASIAIGAIWLAVALTAIFGPDMRFESSPTNVTVIPSAVAVGLFALLATSAVAKSAFGRGR